ncbi:NADPH-dependent FMN reductase [Maribacter sp. X9]|uniref:NADPH-dependent FMN reductase n=1 Tax=Maribacter sp. X9 TaxID=3402159 RepID=UPI003AF3CFA2
MSYVLAFTGSNSSTSINYKLLEYTASLLQDEKIGVLNMVDYPFPMYSEDYEKENGHSNSLVELMNEIRNAKGLIIAVNEHNGYPSAYFKNLLDWLSRVDQKFLIDKKIFLMAASPGGRGAVGALEAAEKMLIRFKGEVVEKFSLPNYGQNFDEKNGIINGDLAKSHKEKLNSFSEAISQ